MAKKEVPLRARVPYLILLEETIYYTLNEVNGMIAPDVAEENQPCYANKAASALAYWAISKHEDGTSIKNVEVIREGKIFDLSGRRVTKMDRGVFIIDGKKIVK